MQTYIVHSLAPIRCARELGWKAFIGFHVLVGGMILSALLHTVFLAAMVTRFALLGLAGFMPADIWDWISILVLVLGYGGAVAVVVSGLAHLRAWHLVAAQALLPVYWLLHSIAALRAAYELVERPSYWAKTTHGVTRRVRGAPLVPRKGFAKWVRRSG